MKKRKFKAMPLLLSSLAVLGCTATMGVATTLIAPTRVYAAEYGSNYQYQVYDYQTTTDKVLMSFNENYPVDSTSTRSKWFNTGIQVYGSTNNNQTSSSSSHLSSSNTVYFDFTNAYNCDKPSDLYEDIMVPLSYDFEVINSSGGVSWRARYYNDFSLNNDNQKTVKESYYTSSSSTVTTSISTDDLIAKKGVWNPNFFGKKSTYLSNGNYTIKITRKYIYYKGASGNFYDLRLIEATETQSVPLLVDGTLPTVTMKDSSGSTVSNGSYVNKKVTVSANDTNLYGIYYKKPGSSSYTYTTSNVILGDTSGWYYVYAKDKVNNKTDEYSFYYDPNLPTGSIQSNGSTVSSGSYISKPFIYTCGDNESGVAKAYYKAPFMTSYQEYTSGTIIPSNAGDGWYYFYSVDKAGNQSATLKVFLETGAPTFTIYKNDTSVYSHSITASGTIDTGLYFKKSDLVKIGYSSVSGVSTTNLTKGSNYAAGNLSGDTYTITTRSATGITANYIIHVVEDVPTLTLDGNILANASTTYINKDTRVYASIDSAILDSADTGIRIQSTGAVNVDTFVSYKDAKNYLLTTPNNTSTTYVITLNDVAGNIQRYRIVVDKVNPVGTWYNGQTPIGDGSHTNKAFHFAFDESLYTATISINGGEYQEYHQGMYDSDGTYIIVLVDKAGNKSTFSLVHDTVAPTGKLYSNNKEVGTGAKTNGAVTFSWDDNDATCTVNGRAYQKNSPITDSGRYHFVLTDKAGNFTEYDIEVDTIAPDGFIYSDGSLVETGSSTNGNVSFVWDESGATCTMNGTPYANGVVIASDGDYHFVLTDDVGNSNFYDITVDKTAPVGKLYSDYKEVGNDYISNGLVMFSWDEANVTCTVNGTLYQKNTVISEDGNYHFVLTDTVGNSRSYDITIDTIAPSNNKDVLSDRNTEVISKWYTVEFDNHKMSFRNYEEALNYAKELEFNKYVATLTLDDVSNFTQTHLITLGDEVKEGTYFRYKSAQNPNTELYYFNPDILDVVITNYAKNYVSGINYYDYENASGFGDLDKTMFDNTWTNYDGTKAPIVNDYVFTRTDSTEIYAKLTGTQDEYTLVDSNIPFGEQFTMTGLYEIKEVDDAGNTTTYYVFLDKDAPVLKVNAQVFGEEIAKEFNIDANSLGSINSYYYKTFSVSEVIDNDSWSTVKITYDNGTSYYTNGDIIPTLDEGGKYIITVYDRVGNNYSFTVYIVGEEANVAFTNNDEATAFDIDISLDQEFDTVISLEIFKDGMKLEGVTPDNLHYTFEKDGNYKVVIKDNFGRVVQRNYKFDKSLPTGDLSCDEGAKTNDNVTFNYDNSKYFVEVYKNGTLVDSDKLGVVSYTEDGNYMVKLINLTDLDNFNTYEFEIDKTSPTINISGTEEGKTTNGNVVISWDDKDVETATYSIDGSEEVAFDNGMTFTSEGTYTITLTDDLGNSTSKTFTIDKSLDYEVYDLTGVVAMGTDMTTSGSVVITDNEALSIEVKKDGEAYEYSFNDALSEEGRYDIRIYDDLGNSSTFTVIIDKSVDYGSNVTNGEVTSNDVYFVTGEKATIIVTKDGNPYEYSWGESITSEGNYVVKMYDSYGNEETVKFSIDKSVAFESNVNDGEGTNNPVIITADENVEVVVTKDGEVIDYNIGDSLSADGNYEVTITDEVGNVETVNFEIDTTAPEITLNGIEDGGKDNVTVSITDMTEEGEIHVYRDGNEIEYELGQELSEYGSYRVEVTDKLGNTRTYSFELAYKVNGAVIALIGVGIALVAGAVVLIILKKKRVFKTDKK